MNSKLLLLAIASLTAVYYSAEVYADSSNNVYQVPNIDFDKYSYTWGEQGMLLMESPLDNKDPRKVEVITSDNSMFKSQIRTYPDSASQENFVLTETGPDTGLFEWTFVISNPNTKSAYGVNSNYVIVSNSTEHIAFNLDFDQNTGYGTTAKITHPDDNTLPSDSERKRVPSTYPSIQFRNGTMTSPYDGQGTLTVQYPSQNKSPVAIDQLKVVFSAHDAHRIFEILDETGPDTGVFEGTLSFSSYKSFSKIYLTKHDDSMRSVTAHYLVSDSTSTMPSSNILLHHGLEYDDRPGRIHDDSILRVQSNQKAYLVDQLIMITGHAGPDEIINISLLSTRGSHASFEQVRTDDDGVFDARFLLSDSSSSGKYNVNAVSIENDKQATVQITITSMDDLQTRSIDVPPLQQSQMGLHPDEIVCKQVWKKLIKPGGKDPACVTLPTYEKLLERGWAKVI